MPKTSSTGGFVLAGGQSRRMGRDKAALPWGDGTLLDHMVRLLSTAADPVRVVGRGGLPDRLPGKGPLGGILTALEAGETEENLIVAVDLPLLTPDFLLMFRDRFLASPKPLLACRVGGRYPLCLGIRRSLGPLVERRLAEGNLAVHNFIENVAAEFLEEPAFQPAIFTNPNTPEEWARLLEPR